MNRWRAVVWYRTEAGSLDCEHLVEELEDLHDLVELGPHWDTIERIEVFRIPYEDANMTVERAEKL
jgi:hypothetical protein